MCGKVQHIVQTMCREIVDREDGRRIWKERDIEDLIQEDDNGKMVMHLQYRDM